MVNSHRSIWMRPMVLLALLSPFILGFPGCDNDSGCQGNHTGNFPHPPTTPPEYFAGPRAIYVADTGNHRIVRLEGNSPSNIISTLQNWKELGTQGSGVRQFNNPSNVVIGPDYRIYIVDTGNNRIARVDNIQGENWTELAQGFNAPRDLAFGPSGEMYIADTGNNRIVRFDNMSGAGFKTLSTVGTFGNLNGPTGVAFVGPGPSNGLQFDNIFIADRGNNRIILTRADLDAAGQRAYGKPDKTPGSGRGEFNQPARVRPAANYFLVLDSANNRVVSLAYNGNVSSMTDPAHLSLSQPFGLELALAGNVIADTGNHRIVSAGGESFGSFGSGVNQFNRPEGVDEGQERVYPERQISRIEVDPTALSLNVGGTTQVLARGFDEKGALNSNPEDWKWRTEDSNIAEVDAPVSGIYRAGNPITIRGKAPGRTNIIVFNITAVGGSGNSITIPVEVKAAPSATGGINVPVR